MAEGRNIRALRRIHVDGEDEILLQPGPSGDITTLMVNQDTDFDAYGEVADIHGSTNEMSITQELIAQLLGVRREGVTEAAGRLQRAGLIHYSRGKIVVVDRAGLEARACECYRVVKTECDRLLPTLASGAARSKSVRTWNPPRARNSSPVAPPV